MLFMLAGPDIISWKSPLWHHFLKYVKLVKHFTPHTSEKGWKIHLFQYLISSSETTCCLSPIDPNCGKKRKDVGVQRHNMILVTQLFLSLQSRPADANMADFFRFENQAEPPSLADRGLLQCLGATTGRVAAAQQAMVVVCVGHGGNHQHGAARTSKNVQ